MTTYSQFGFGGPLGDNFVRQNEDGTATQFFYTADGVITTKEFDSTELENLLRTIQYNTLLDGVMDYAFATGQDYAIEAVHILGNGEDDEAYNGLNDYVEAGLGNDVIAPGDGQNEVYGGDGEDFIIASQGYDLLFGNKDDDSVQGGSGNDYVFGGGGADFVNGGPGEDVISGGADDDILTGGNGHDIIFDLFGNNNISGHAGDDFIIAGDGDDTIKGDQGDDIIHAGGGADVVRGDDGNDHIFGGDGDDALYGGAGDDVIYADAGDDYVNGYGDNDIIYGGAGSDNLLGDAGNDKLYADDPSVHGVPSDDKLLGGQGEDELYGGYGRDLLKGGLDDDLLVARGHGQSVMWGEQGADTFAFDGLPEGKAHQIKDFTFGEDVINISDLLDGFDSLTSSIDDFVRIFFRDEGRTDLKVNVDGTGDDWTPVVSILADFTGTSPGIMLAAGDLVADHKLFASDVV